MDGFFRVCLLCLLSASALAESVVLVDASGYVSFARLDSDRNGYVSRVEARIATAISEEFDAADVNRDGLLDREEYPYLPGTTDLR